MENIIFVFLFDGMLGQQPDGIILAFTKTSDWVLSKEIVPPPVAYDTHYLCTVSLRGHRKLVKPIRYGIRKTVSAANIFQRSQKYEA